MLYIALYIAVAMLMSLVLSRRDKKVADYVYGFALTWPITIWLIGLFEMVEAWECFMRWHGDIPDGHDNDDSNPTRYL